MADSNKNVFSRLYFILCIAIIITALLSAFADAGGGRSRGRAPPPPPPPCPIQSAGCYKIGDVKAGFGELSPTEFGYFLPENKCKREGGCDCRGVPDSVPQESNPDDSSGACNCIAGTDWNAKARCCGDDTDDCGKISSGVLCSIDANSESAQWLPSTANLGDIRYVGCSRLEYLSDGNSWFKCEGTFWKRTIGNSEYVCIGRGRESIVECCGDGSCKSRVDGKRLSTGQSVNPEKFSNESIGNDLTGNAIVAAESKTHYCRPDRKFVTDLDVPASQVKDKVLIGKTAATCEKAGLKWTGTKCCSEDDDPGEYYNDPGTIGGCWDKKPVLSISFVDGTGDSVVNFKGGFHGCAIDKNTFNKDNNGLLDLADKHTGAQLITNHEYCFNDPEKNYYCSYLEKWLPTDGTDKTHVSFAPVQNPIQVADCCAADECWDGSQCVENMKANPLAQPIGNNSRCIDGEWTNSELRVTADDSASGYCPKKTDCLANVFGKDTESQCFESGEYFDDNLCENGIWSTRTKLLALKLIEMKGNDFSLSCDKPENALNNLQYTTESNEVVASILSSLKANNFCVLKAGGKTIAATSINKNLQEVPDSSLKIFGVSSCDEALIDDGKYHPCDASNRAWLNMRQKSFIYSTSAITISSGQDNSTFSELVGNPIRNIIDSLKRLISEPPFDESYVKGARKFDKLYISREAGRTIRGTVEGPKFKNAVVEYSGFDVDMCKFLDQFSQAKKDVSSGISCKKEGSTYYALIQGSQFSNINPDDIWPDLTSKLRSK